MNLDQPLFRYLTAVLIAFSLMLPALAKSDKELQQIDPPSDLEIPDAPVLTPEQALESFQVEEGFEVQLVAAEPLIEDPVCMAWDERGRLWVCEMLGYMKTIDAEGETDPIGNIVILEDTDGDGQMDKRTVFLDKIVLPRAIAFAKNGILYADTTTLWFVRINANGSAGAKMPIDRNYSNNGGRPANVEHQANGLLYGLDNWYYSAKSSRRYQNVNGRFRRGTTEFRGQWGITQDDDGRLLANRNPVLVEYHLYPPSATLRNPNYTFKGAPILRTDNSVYPIRVTPGTNRAYRPNQDVNHETWKLQRATAACGPVIYRGTQFPEEYYNNIFVAEPAGHLVKRLVLSKDEDGKPTVEHAYKDKEFFASTDERSRIVNNYVGPDGALYMLDMYRGVIQHKGYLSAYFKRQIKSRNLDTPIGLGRIYRVVHKDSPIDHTPPNLADMDSVDLVPLLGHTNAWHRMTAQRLLVQRRDASAVEALELMATTGANPQARIHALWTLKGMGKLTPGLLYTAGTTENTRVRVQVLRLAEDFEAKPEAKQFVSLLKQYDSESRSWELDLQLAFTAGILASIDTPEAYDVLASVIDRRSDDRLFRHAAISGLRGKEAVMLAKVSDGPIKGELTGALVKATENGDLTIGSLLELINQPEFAESRSNFLKTLSVQAVDQDRYEVIDQLIGKLQGATLEEQAAILAGMTEARSMRATPIELIGKPEVFETLATDTPETLVPFVEQFDQTFVYEREVIDAALAKRIELGEILYGTHCSACHAADGNGIVKTAPPIVQSEWTEMHPKVLAMLVLNGVEGDIMVNGKLYTSPEDTPGIMPGLKAVLTSDEDVANILTYIRSKEFRNNGDPVDVQTVAEVRQMGATRNSAYSVDELIAIDAKLRGITPVLQASNAPQIQLAKHSWLTHTERNLVLTLLAVLIPLIVLLVVTCLGALAKPID